MPFIKNLSQIEFKPHPKIPGVRIGYILLKEESPTLSLIVLELSPKVEVPIHMHDVQVDSIFVLEGRGEVYLNGEWKEVKAGDVVVILPGEEHALRAKEEGIRCYIAHGPAFW
jgi:quercetin dioxygenase-like cupin family protein